MAFQLDTSIPLSVRPSTFNPLQTLQGLSQLRASQDEAEYRRQLLASNRDTMLRKQRDDAETATTEQAYDTAGGDRQKTLDALPPHLRPKVLAVFAKADEAQAVIDQHTATLKDTNEKIAKAKTARNATWAWGVHQAGNTPQALNYALTELAKTDPEAAAAARAHFGNWDTSITPDQIAQYTNYAMNQDPDMVKQLDAASEEERKKSKDAHEKKMYPSQEAEASAKSSIALLQAANQTKEGLLPAEAAANKRAEDALKEEKRYHDQLNDHRGADGGLTVQGRNIAIRHRADQMAALDRLFAEDDYNPTPLRIPEARRKAMRDQVQADYEAQLAPMDQGRAAAPAPSAAPPPDALPGPRQTPEFPGPGGGRLGDLLAPQAPFEYHASPAQSGPAPSDLLDQMTRLRAQLDTAAPGQRAQLQAEYARLRAQYLAAGGR